VFENHPEFPLSIRPRLVAPEHPSEGTSAWFVIRWNRLTPVDQDRFRSYMSGLLHLTDPLDFCVDVDERPRATVAVVFYIHSALTELANVYFRANASPLRRALQLLHDPEQEYHAFWAEATGRQPQQFQDAFSPQQDAGVRQDMRACLQCSSARCPTSPARASVRACRATSRAAPAPLPPSSVVFAALTMASTSSVTIFACSASIVMRIVVDCDNRFTRGLWQATVRFGGDGLNPRTVRRR
jgi:hypothetical protein